MDGLASRDDIEYSSLPVANFLGDNSKVYQWNGVWLLPWQLQSAQQILSQFKPLPTDVILASFPKTGTTWMKSLLFCILNRPSKTCVLTTHPHLLVPTLEADLYGTQPAVKPDEFASLKSSPNRIFATHLPYHVLKDVHSSSGCRVVYVTRNPKDTLISYWHFVRNSIRYETPAAAWPVQDAVNMFCSGAFPNGPYFEHVLGFRDAILAQPNKIFFITYEELKHDCKTHVKKMAHFLGCPFVGDDGDDELEEIVKICGFENQSEYEVNQSTTEVVTLSKFPFSSFFRQGVVGDYKNYLDAETINRIDAITKHKFHASGFMYGT